VSRKTSSKSRFAAFLLATSVSSAAMFAAALSFVGCGPALSGGEGADWPELQKKWYDRAAASFAELDVTDAESAIQNALRVEPEQEQVRLLAANIALSQLRYDEAIRHLQGLTSKKASGLRARALWYSGQITGAAEELGRLLADPEVKDPWAEGVQKLAQHGQGREPFRITGALLASVDMPRVPAPTMIIPLELNGEPALALLATGSAEVVIDATQREPSWVSLRFASRLEVKDVPALTRDLSGLSRKIGAPIKLLLGVNLLRRLNATVDFYAGQFIVRTFAPPPPPEVSSLNVSYLKGGGMVLRTRFGTEPNAPAAALLVDTGVLFPVAMDAEGWKKAGTSPDKFEAVQGQPGVKQGTVPRLTLGAFDIPGVPGVYGLPLEDFEKDNDIHLDGVIGSALLAEFRFTLVDGGKTLWLEEMPRPAPPASQPGGQEAPAPAGEEPVSSSPLP
jgi:hypothetical protein